MAPYQMEWVTMGFSWFLFVASIVAWVATSDKAERKLSFWLILAAGWACFGAASTLVVTDTAVREMWWVAAITIGGWVFIAWAVVLSIWEQSEERFY